MTREEAEYKLAEAREQEERHTSLEASRLREGGPAYPQPCGAEGHACNNWYGIAGGGMSRRDYFAAHAPEEPASWFEYGSPGFPKPTPYPSEPKGAAFCEGCKMDDRCHGTPECLAMHDYRERCNAVSVANRRGVYVAWRWAYADAMIGGVCQ